VGPKINTCVKYYTPPLETRVLSVQVSAAIVFWQSKKQKK